MGDKTLPTYKVLAKRKEENEVIWAMQENNLMYNFVSISFAILSCVGCDHAIGYVCL